VVNRDRVVAAGGEEIGGDGDELLAPGRTAKPRSHWSLGRLGGLRRHDPSRDELPLRFRGSTYVSTESLASGEAAGVEDDVPVGPHGLERGAVIELPDP